MIRLLIVDDIPETRDHLSKLLSFESDIEVVGMAASGQEALELAKASAPDVALVDINMPGMDGITLTQRLAAEVPTVAVIMMSVQGEADYLRRSMLAGAREFLVKPFSSDELTTSIRQVFANEREKLERFVPVSQANAQEQGTQGRVIAVFSPKGGVGRTTISVNMAVAAAKSLGIDTYLIDASLQFGDIGVLMNLSPKALSIANLVGEFDAPELESLDTFTALHESGVKVMLAPPAPETAELVTPAAIKRLINETRKRHDVVIVDCPAWFNDVTLAVLDEADIILTVLTLEITAIKDVRLFLDLSQDLDYESKVRLVLNRADAALGIRLADVEQSLGRSIEHSIVSDGRSVVYALNRGVPFFLSHNSAQISQDILRLASAICVEPKAETGAEKRGRRTGSRRSLFAWR